MSSSKMTVPPQFLSAQFAPDSASDEKRTVNVDWYTGAQVLRFSWLDGVYLLTMSMDPEHVRMGRLESGASPMLDAHGSESLADVLGVIDKAWLENGVGKATVRFSGRDEVTPIWNDVKAGIIRNISMGIWIHKLKETTKENDKQKSFLAVDWEPFEVSLVPVGADPGARVQASALSANEVEIEFADGAASPKEKTMNEQSTGATALAAPDPAVVTATEQGTAAERQRVLEITKIQQTGKLKAEFAAEHIKTGTSVEEFRRLAFDQLAARSEENPTRGHNSEITRDEVATRREGFAQAILARGNVISLNADQPGYQYRGLASMGLMRLAEECVRNLGKNPSHMTKDQIAQVALSSTSDLPYVLQDSANKSLRAGYEKAPQTWLPISAKRTAANFKTQYEVMLNSSATFQRVGEDGEIKTGYLSDGRESWSVYTYAQIIRMTRQTLINDDLGALTTVPRQLGLKAAIKQSNLVWGVVTTNGNLSDSVALFASGHSNYTSSGTAISVDSIGVGRQTMRVQTDGSGDYIDIEPKFLVVPTAKEQLARQYTSPSYTPATAANQNPWAGTLTPIAEPRLDANSATAWYLFADPEVAPVLVYAYLEGQEGIYSEFEQGFEIDGINWKARMDFGTGAIDYRGGYKNAGA